MTVERYTLDTNLLIYAVDRTAGAKHKLAAEIVDRSVERPCVLTLQALAEFVYAVTRKNLVPTRQAVAQARDWLEVFPIAPASVGALDAAYSVVEAHKLNLFDALLLATARAAGCTVVLSEDMHDGGAFGGLTVRNPLVEGGMPHDLRVLVGLA